MALVSRPYHDETDYALIRELLERSLAATGPAAYCTPGDLDWWRWGNGAGDEIEQTRLWLTGDSAVAFAWPGQSSVDVVCEPGRRELEAEIYAWAERRATPGSASFKAWSYERDSARRALLERRGYERSAEHFVMLAQELGANGVQPVLPDGFVLRTVQAEDDVARRVAVHRDAFAPSRYTETKQRNVMRAPSYRRDLDLVVEAPDGEFAAFCIVWHNAANGHGVFEPVGTAAAYRGRGLATAVLHAGLRRLRELGARTAAVNTYGGEKGAGRLYEAAGFRVVDRNYAWVRNSRNAE